MFPFQSSSEDDKIRLIYMPVCFVTAKSKKYCCKSCILFNVPGSDANIYSFCMDYVMQLHCSSEA